MAEPSTRALVELLRADGPRPARGVQEALGVSQPTLSRMVRAAGADVVRIGRARRSRYALSREVRALGRSWPVYRVRPEGAIAQVATLHALHPRTWWWETSVVPGWLRPDFADGIFPDLPWFLDDLRPQGFLGRAFARRHADALELGTDPRIWSADGVLAALLRFGDDLPGDFVIGDAAAGRVQAATLRAPDTVREEERATRYEELAAAVLAGEVTGSSAGGEQPKFVCCRQTLDGAYRHVLVKFSPPVDIEAGRRWADLMRCEHLAAQVLRTRGVASVETAWVEGPRRAFLEVTRFDRDGAHGRRGVVSLHAFDAAHYGALDSWTAAADRMERDGWLTTADAATLRVRWWFGHLIANTDMHFGNVSLLLDSNRPLSLAPTYDMLPMLYRPTEGGEVVERRFDAALPPPRERGAWMTAAAMAVEYWERVAEDGFVSEGFRAEARLNAERVRTVSAHRSLT